KRLEAETGDVNAAVDYAKANLPVDAARVVVMGFSFGGMVATIAASRDHSFAAAIAQAPGALSWGKTQAPRDELLEHADKIRVPLLCMVAENDATTESARKICAQAQTNGAATKLIVYPPFRDPRNQNPAAPGHALFTNLGVSIWQKDVLDFLSNHVAAGAKSH